MLSTLPGSSLTSPDIAAALIGVLARPVDWQLVVLWRREDESALLGSWTKVGTAQKRAV
jgi:hypothetical protein